MTRALLAWLFVAFGVPGVANAHRLDEYLQATRVAFGGDRIEVEIDLIPGAAMASDVMTRLDRNSDNTVSPIEAAEYARVVLRDLTVTIDRRPVVMTLIHVDVAPFDELSSGVGAIQLRALGLVGGRGKGPHQVYFRNDHRPDVSVYSVNALIPEDSHIRVLGQTRDPRQQEAHIDYSVGPQWFGQVLWMAFGSAGFLMLMAVRRLPGRVVSFDGTT